MVARLRTRPARLQTPHQVLNVVDDATRECLLAVSDTSLCGKRVVRELTAIVAQRGRPLTILSGSGTELRLERRTRLVRGEGIASHHITSDKLMQNAFFESFKGRMRDELLNLFLGLRHARVKLAT